MGLNVGVICTEQGFHPIDGQVFGFVDVLATTVVALAGIAFGVFVGQHGTLRLHNPGAGVVLRSNQFDVLLLAALFFANGAKDLVVKSLDSHAFVEHAVLPAEFGGWPRIGKRGILQNKRGRKKQDLMVYWADVGV